MKLDVFVVWEFIESKILKKVNLYKAKSRKHLFNNPIPLTGATVKITNCHSNRWTFIIIWLNNVKQPGSRELCTSKLVLKK